MVTYLFFLSIEGPYHGLFLGGQLKKDFKNLKWVLGKPQVSQRVGK